MPMSHRREFLRTTSSTIAAVAASAGFHAAGAEKQETVNLGIVGCGGIMSHHVKGLVGRHENVRFQYLCDVDERQIDRMAENIKGFQSSPPVRTSKFEDVIHDKNVDAVIIATPHHWHAPIAIAAMQNSKDCYIEKPISHVFNEGPAIIAASKKYQRIVQQGSQMRSSPVTAKAAKLLADGIIGDIKVARAWTAEIRNVVKPVPDSPTPPGVDYDRWLGPAPSRPFNRHRFHGSWRMYRDYANGEI
ncbi:MAG: Gfo/Idh/MocA family oxidoreductase, partial [Planctomycetales bacterium]|nr:Gfo/Idh/MocA family oxidoreductase [Planctomycetales bacterium]